MNIGSGILPVSIKNQQIFFLFGLERDGYIPSVKGYSDFGGKSDLDEDIKDTACREAFEESNGFLGTPKALKKKLNNNLILSIKSGQYTSFLIKFKYSKSLIKRFKSNYNCIKKNHPDIIKNNHLFEKKKLKWISETQMRENNIKFRNFYRQEIIPQILENIDNIRSKL